MTPVTRKHKFKFSEDNEDLGPRQDIKQVFFLTQKKILFFVFFGLLFYLLLPGTISVT